MVWAQYGRYEYTSDDVYFYLTSDSACDALAQKHNK